MADAKIELPIHCARCNHPEDWHRHDDATGGALPGTLEAQRMERLAEFRCVGYDCEVGGPIPSRGCSCPDFVSPRAQQESMSILRRLRCWLRNYHRWMVPELALIGSRDSARLMNVFEGECADCGAVTYRTAERWQHIKSYHQGIAQGGRDA